MNIVDMRFKAEILSSKGKVHRFDSIECMAAWSQDHPEETSGRWVTSAFHPEKWLPMERAFFLKADRLSSPMGASLSAYETEEELRRALQEFGGRVLSGKDLEDFIRGPWRKEVFLREKP
jgi:copper chaperone NosL